MKKCSQFREHFYNRRRRDSNSRATKSDNLISSQARYDRFDTPPQLVYKVFVIKSTQIIIKIFALNMYNIEEILITT